MKFQIQFQIPNSKLDDDSEHLLDICLHEFQPETVPEVPNPTSNKLNCYSQIVPELLELDSAKPFLKPVNAKDEKHRLYHKMIRDPMDLTSIHNRLKNNFYKTAQNCTDDFLLLFQNASHFYSKGDPEFKAASSLKQIWKTSIKNYLQEEKNLKIRFKLMQFMKMTNVNFV